MAKKGERARRGTGAWWFQAAGSAVTGALGTLLLVRFGRDFNEGYLSPAFTVIGGLFVLSGLLSARYLLWEWRHGRAFDAAVAEEEAEAAQPVRQLTDQELLDELARRVAGPTADTHDVSTGQPWRQPDHNTGE